MKKSLFIASLIAAFALAACNKPAEQAAPETTENAPEEAAPDANQAAPAPEEQPAETLEAPASDAEKSEGNENK
ncbi:Putative outer membrane protein H.8 precursor (modular protein) [Candidatus Glomeribacter gigasporarum BEG34]|uniref:Putative outer membrane protein H.8 (Modular protein) n=1 Tax=Candidatus Glomeribacter gigasporarum BEG34 TaxID=1070319 RepID=G2J8D6_9BURK|nr:membrane lipoprotein lipid attachment site-containing protein [Candidatus Glomeribacter gigasporarum]CCD29033.1 Putative outer membrane protein H.8 precursor (modular protein) [Candidatus Glomeribacter gigasporarum BEG34]